MSRGGARDGAGRPGWLGKAEHYPRLDVRLWQRSGALRAGAAGVWAWPAGAGQPADAVSYRATDTELLLRFAAGGTAFERVIELDQTEFVRGRYRRWWICPACGKRTAILYLRDNRVACMTCQQLISVRDALGRFDRIESKAFKIGRRLGPDQARPRGMHHSTYHRHIRDFNRCLDELDEDTLDPLRAYSVLLRLEALHGRSAPGPLTFCAFTSAPNE